MKIFEASKNIKKFWVERPVRSTLFVLSQAALLFLLIFLCALFQDIIHKLDEIEYDKLTFHVSFVDYDENEVVLDDNGFDTSTAYINVEYKAGTTKKSFEDLAEYVQDELDEISVSFQDTKAIVCSEISRNDVFEGYVVSTILGKNNLGNSLFSESDIEKNRKVIVLDSQIYSQEEGDALVLGNEEYTVVKACPSIAGAVVPFNVVPENFYLSRFQLDLREQPTRVRVKQIYNKINELFPDHEEIILPVAIDPSERPFVIFVGIFSILCMILISGISLSQYIFVLNRGTDWNLNKKKRVSCCELLFFMISGCLLGMILICLFGSKWIGMLYYSSARFVSLSATLYLTIGYGVISLIMYVILLCKELRTE